MATKTINLSWEGYYPENNKNGKLLQISKHKCSGIYAVYAGKSIEEKKCCIRKLLYIGEAQNVVEERLTDKHECYECWEEQLKDGEKLYFCIADVYAADRERAEAALIYKTCPPCNEQCTQSFSYDTTTIESDGEHKFIPGSFTVLKK